MATWYTDVALAQQQLNNFPGAPGQAQIAQPPFTQNHPSFEGPPEIVATYTMTGSEAAGDTINIAVLGAGVLVDPNGHVSTGLTAPGATMTLAVGDNDLGYIGNLPIPNAAAAVAAVGMPSTTLQAPIWVSGASYVPGNVVLDSSATASPFTQYDGYLCVAATSGTTAPHSAATTVWYPLYNRYSGSLNVASASANVAFTGAIQFYGGPASIVPFSTNPGVSPTGYATAAIAANQPYVIQYDCWAIARILTLVTPAAGAVLVFRIPLLCVN